MKKALTFLSIIAALIAAYIVLFPKNNPVKKLFTKSTPAPGSTNTKTGTSGQQPAATNSASAPAGFPLSEGSRGLYVTQLQNALNKYFDATLKVDGIFGPKTAAAIAAAKFDPTNVSYTDYLDILNG
jgi:hypothetical protein